jgi:hypothetical protein
MITTFTKLEMFLFQSMLMMLLLFVYFVEFCRLLLQKVDFFYKIHK